MSDSPTILVVDDFSTMRRIIKKVLKGMEIENVVEAENGEAAWEILNNQTIDLIICDWNMPGMNGMQLLEKARSRDDLAEIPFLMVTAESKEKMTVTPGEEGKTDYIAKPFKGDQLAEKINAML